VEKKRGMTSTVIGCALGLSLFAGPGCSTASSTNQEGGISQATTDCSRLEPKNPFSAGLGFAAGFDWAEKNKPTSCSGNSPSASFIDGCNEYLRQTRAHDACVRGQ
jgi:hypothetical protein